MKRIAMPKTWPIARKGKPRLIIEPRGSLRYSLPILVVIRDLLKIAKTAKEAKKIFYKGSVLVNNKIVHDAAYPVNIFDIVSIPEIKKHFVLLLGGKRLTLKEIPEKDASLKVFKIIGKKILNKGKIQFNLFGGKNFIFDIKAKVNDSILWDLNEDKLLKHMPLKENARVFITAGRNSGLEGVVVKIDAKSLNIKIENKIIKSVVANVWVVG